MKDEIKEILDYFREFGNRMDCNFINQLEDYITNLQEENKKFIKKSYKDDVIITKAIEYIEMVKHFALIDKVNIISISTLENILQGSDD